MKQQINEIKHISIPQNYDNGMHEMNNFGDLLNKWVRTNFNGETLTKTQHKVIGMKIENSNI